MAVFSMLIATGASKQSTDKEWNISSTASTLADWTTDSVLAGRLDISARVLSVREDGCHIDVGSQDGVVVGQVFQIYRVLPGGGSEEVEGEVQIAWTREDYSFAEPRGDLDMDDVTTLHFARIVNIPPVVRLISDTSEGGGSVDLDRLMQAIYGLLSLRGTTRPILGRTPEPAWELTLTPDLEGLTIRASLADPGGEITGNIVVNPLTGNRVESQTWLDPSYLTGAHTPFEHFLAPPGRRQVRIACGNIIPGSPDELAVLDGADLWVYDLSWAEPRLITSLTISIPPGPVRHREDAGSLEIADLNGDGIAEVCIAPPGGSRSEIYRFEDNAWVLLDFLPDLPHASDPGIAGVVVAPYLIDHPAIDQSNLRWMFPFSEIQSQNILTGIPLLDVDIIPDSRTWLPGLVAVDTRNKMHIFPARGESITITGEWGHRIASVMSRGATIVLAASTGITTDKLILLDPFAENILAEFASPSGPIIDIATGDIDSDSKSEIITAMLGAEGVRIYY